MGIYKDLTAALTGIANTLVAAGDAMNFDKSGATRKYLGIVKPDEATDEGTTEGAKKGWETRRAGGGVGGGEEDYDDPRDRFDWLELLTPEQERRMEEGRMRAKEEAEENGEINEEDSRNYSIPLKYRNQPLPMDEKSVRARKDAEERDKAKFGKYANQIMQRRVDSIINELRKSPRW